MAVDLEAGLACDGCSRGEAEGGRTGRGGTPHCMDLAQWLRARWRGSRLQASRGSWAADMWEGGTRHADGGQGIDGSHGQGPETTPCMEGSEAKRLAGLIAGITAGEWWPCMEWDVAECEVKGGDIGAPAVRVAAGGTHGVTEDRDAGGLAFPYRRAAGLVPARHRRQGAQPVHDTHCLSTLFLQRAIATACSCSCDGSSVGLLGA